MPNEQRGIVGQHFREQRSHVASELLEALLRAVPLDQAGLLGRVAIVGFLFEEPKHSKLRGHDEIVVLAAVEASRQDVAQAELTRVLAVRALSTTTGLSATPGGPALEDDLHDEAPLESWESAAIGGLPSIVAANLDARAARKNADATRDALVPTVSATGTERFTNAAGFGTSPYYAIGASLVSVIATSSGAACRASGMNPSKTAAAWSRPAPVAAIPAIATRAYMHANALAIGSVVPAFEGVEVPLQIVAEVTSFPTVTAPGGALITENVFQLDGIGNAANDHRAVGVEPERAQRCCYLGDSPGFTRHPIAFQDQFSMVNCGRSGDWCTQVLDLSPSCCVLWQIC